MSIITDAKKVYGKAVPDFGDFYGCIENWDNIFSNFPPWRQVKKSGLFSKGDRAMGMLCAAKVLADEFARLTFSEQVTVSAAEPYLDYVTKALNDNGFWKRMPEFLSRAYALGGGVVKVYAEDKKPRLNYIAADRFAPTAWDEHDITEGVLESRIRRDGFFYTLFERHGFSEDGCTEVSYRLYRSSQRNSIGKPVPLSELYPDVDETVTYNTAEPMLRYFKPDVSNNIDRCCPLGVSVFSSAADTLKALDVAFDSFGREFVLGKKRIIVPSSCVQTVVDIETGTPKRYFDADDEAFIALKCDEDKDLKITDNTVELRIEEHVAAINALLNILCFQTGLSSGTFSFEGSQGLKTATEVISADSKTARTAKGNKNLVAELIEGIVRSIIVVGIEMGDLSESDDYGILVTMPDGVVIDDNTKIDNNIKLVQSGLKSKLAAIMDVQNCDEGAAQKELDRIAKENQISADTVDLLTIGDSEIVSEPTESEVIESAEDAAGKTLNGAQTQSLISVIAQYQSNAISLGQAVNIISVAIGVSKDEAKKIIEGAE